MFLYTTKDFAVEFAAKKQVPLLSNSKMEAIWSYESSIMSSSNLDPILGKVLDSQSQLRALTQSHRVTEVHTLAGEVTV